jgi:hypothetical protein
MNFNYLRNNEVNMPLSSALLQIALGLDTCKTKKEVVYLLYDCVELGRRERDRER